jgi:small subunit ribosomal protein S16
MVSIRLSRAGAKKRPFYHLVVSFFNPVGRDHEENLRIDVERVDYWIGQGAQPSDRVASLLKQHRKAAAAN